MLTKEQFLQAAKDAGLAKYPAVAALIKAGDPRVLQQIEAQATMLAMYSAQVEVAQAEPFEKVRDSTVLADAALRGIVPKARAARVRLHVVNASERILTLHAGRELLDPKGRIFSVEAPCTVAAGEEAYALAIQSYRKATSHIVSGSRPFYAVHISLADDDSALCGLAVRDGTGEFAYRERYANTLADERIYHVEADERQQVYVRFGQDGVVGTQPLDGTQIMLTASYTLGAAEFSPGALLTFATLHDPLEALLEMRLDEVLVHGQNPPTMRALRELAKYPSVYNHNAVFLGEFDFLVRRHFPDLSFLSVWNEGVEESVRGMHLDNINALFVACVSAQGSEPVLEEQGEEMLSPEKISVLSGVQQQIAAQIKAADDSYRIHFYTPIRRQIALSVQASVASSYDGSAVQAQIEQVILQHFGEDSPAAQRGQSVPLYQQIYRLLLEQVPALAVGRADLRVQIDPLVDSDHRPELWRFVAPTSLTVQVTTGNITIPHWGGGL
ncbi:MAG: hypothetical protein ACRCYV_02495 [Aeromonas sp.]